MIAMTRRKVKRNWKPTSTFPGVNGGQKRKTFRDKTNPSTESSEGGSAPKKRGGNAEGKSLGREAIGRRVSITLKRKGG